jgi:hypothetical protein
VQCFYGVQLHLQKKLAKTQNRGAINLTRKGGLENDAVTTELNTISKYRQ